MEKVMESENIIYIKVTENLIDDYLKMVNDPEVQNKISKVKKQYSKEQEIEWIRLKQEQKSIIFSMLEKDTNKYIGNIEIMNIINNIGEIGICITSDMQDKHYGTEALKKIIDYAYRTLGLDGLELNVYASNPRAIHCYENVGFIKDGVGKSADDIHMKYTK